MPSLESEKRSQLIRDALRSFEQDPTRMPIDFPQSSAPSAAPSSPIRTLRVPLEPPPRPTKISLMEDYARRQEEAQRRKEAAAALLALQRSQQSGRRKGVRISDAEPSVREYEIEGEFLKHQEGKQRTRTGVVLGSAPEFSARYLPKIDQIEGEQGFDCFDERARQELIRILPSIRSLERLVRRPVKDSADAEARTDLQTELQNLYRQKSVLYRRCGFDESLAFGYLKKSLKNASKSEQKKIRKLMYYL